MEPTHAFTLDGREEAPNLGTDLDTRSRYKVGHELGRGGMGEVVSAHDPALNRELAMKLLQADHLGDTVMRRRFREESLIHGQI